MLALKRERERGWGGSDAEDERMNVGHFRQEQVEGP